jgi:GrpB-like predicted nucleotidyltransferase (UPF0157 family)
MEPQVVIAPYNEKWAVDFAVIEAELKGFLQKGLISIAQSVMSIEHVGSTSVPGLCAKPIIDVDIIARDEESMESITAAITAGGEYAYRGELGVLGRHALRFLNPRPQQEDGVADQQRPARNVYVVSNGCQALRNHLTVRDTLRADSALRDQYGRVKMELANRGVGRYEYTEAKSEILQHILKVGGMSKADRDEIRETNSDVVGKVIELRAKGLLEDWINR